MKIKSIENKKHKPRLRVCYACNKRLYQDYHAIVKCNESGEHDFVLHRECARKSK